MKTIILAGGLGTRLSEETVVRPKPMVEVGDKPMLWHIMNLYSVHGFSEFVVALGYKGEIIRDYFLNYHALTHDLTIDLGTGNTIVHGSSSTDWRIHLVDTGADTQTGGRVKRLKDWIGGETFMLTYGDGLADVDISGLLRFHRQQGKLATVTAVRPPARFGGLELEGNSVRRFSEKPQSGEGWINGGFLVMEPEALDYISGDDQALEGECMERLSVEGQLASYRHEGFWQAMDTLREKNYLNELWRTGMAPWRTLRSKQALVAA